MISRLTVSLVGRISAAALQVAIIALLARALGVELFGVFSLSFALSLLALGFLDLGMGTRVLRGVDSDYERRALTTFTISRLVSLLAIPTIAYAVALTNHADPVVVAAAATYAVGEATGDIAVAIRQGRRSSVSAMFALLARRMGALIPVVVVQSHLGAVSSMIIAAILGASIYAMTVFRHLGRPIGLLRLARENFSILATSGASSFSQLDVTLVASTINATAAGLYGAGIRLFNPINLAVTTMLQVLIPELSSTSSLQLRKRRFIRARNIVLLFSSLVAAASVAAPAILSALYGPDFRDGAPIAVAVFVAAAISALAQVHLSWFLALGVPRIVPIGLWLSVGVGLIAIYLLSLHLGLLGASIGLVAMHALSAAAIIIPCTISLKNVEDD